jgi:hypothetical protein
MANPNLQLALQDLQKAINELNTLSGQNYSNLLTGISNDAVKIANTLKLVNSLIEKLKDETNYLDDRFKSILNTMTLMIPTNAAHYQGIKSLKSVADNLLSIKRGELDIDYKSTVVARDSIKLAKEYLEVEKKQRENTINKNEIDIINKRAQAQANRAIIQQINQQVNLGNITKAQAQQSKLAYYLKSLELYKEIRILRGINTEEKKRIEILEEQQKQADTLDRNYRKALVTHIKTNKELGIMGASVKALDALTKNMGIDGLNFESAYQDTLKEAQAAKDAGKSFDAIGHFTNIIKQNLVGILDPIQLIQKGILALYKATTAADKSTGELAKSFGISYAEAASLRNELNIIANLSADTNINTASLQKALIELNKQFSTATMLNGELLKDYTKLTEVAGYTAEAAAGLSKITVATGTDLSKNTAKILGQAIAFNAINKLALNEKEIVEAVAKTSAATTLSLGMQPGKIAEANLQAKALGTTLEKVEQIASSLLQFESSIEAELSAELLIGRDLYLEKARLLALNNDLAGAAEEIAKQIGTAADFTNMNVIQQEALAKAVGMTREDLAKSLIEREALARIGEGDKTALEAYNRLKKEGLSDDQIALKLGDDKLAAQLRSQSIQERFNKSIEKLQEIFVSLAEPILQIVSPFMDLATTILPLINIVLTPILEIFKFIGESVQFFVSGVKEAFGWFSEISGIFSPIVEMWKEFKKDNEGLFKIFSAIGGVLKFVVGMLTTALIIQKGILLVNTFLNKQKLLGLAISQKGILTNLKDLGILIGKAAMTAFASVAKTPFVGPILGAIAVASAVALGAKFLKGNDIVSAGYGKRTLLAPEGVITLNNKDTVIAGTKLFKGDDIISAPQGRINMPPSNPQPSKPLPPPPPQPILVTINNSYDGTQFETARNISRRQIQ